MAFGNSGWRSFFGRAAASQQAHGDGGAAASIEPARQAMLAALTPDTRRLHAADPDRLGGRLRLRARIRCCADAQGLWFMRSEWLAAIGEDLDEQQARRRLLSLNAHFKGLVPDSLLRAAGPPSRVR